MSKAIRRRITAVNGGAVSMASLIGSVVSRSSWSSWSSRSVVGLVVEPRVFARGGGARIRSSTRVHHRPCPRARGAARRFGPGVGRWAGGRFLPSPVLITYPVDLRGHAVQCGGRWGRSRPPRHANGPCGASWRCSGRFTPGWRVTAFRRVHEPSGMSVRASVAARSVMRRRTSAGSSGHVLCARGMVMP